MPKLWTETIEEHRSAVREATQDTAAALVSEHGLMSVTMTQIAEATGIGRATLYKYFPDVETILVAWHERLIAHHLDALRGVRDQTRTPRRQLEAVLEAYAFHQHEHQGTELAALLHRDDHYTTAEKRLRGFIRDILAEGVVTGQVRDDVPPEELSTYCLYALTAANELATKAAIRRLVKVTLAGVRPRIGTSSGPSDRPQTRHIAQTPGAPPGPPTA